MTARLMTMLIWAAVLAGAVAWGLSVFTRGTPVPPGARGRVPGDEVAYNAAAAEVMKDEGVATNDLHAFAASRLAEIGKPADVHYTPSGSKVLATQVASRIEAALPKPVR